jgi:hypothetical protein
MNDRIVPGELSIVCIPLSSKRGKIFTQKGFLNLSEWEHV